MADNSVSTPSPAATPTHFERLGLPRRYGIDLTELERNYLARSRELHPDYHQQSSAAQQRLSMELTAALNDAYTTLKQPFRRAEYLLQLLGGPTAAGYKEIGSDFLEEMLDLRMEIEDLREAGDPDSPRWLQMERELSKREAALAGDLARRFAQLDALAADDSGRQGVMVQIRQVLNAAKYVQGLLRDLTAE